MKSARVPRTLSTQHPDNVAIPFFATSPILRGDDEIREAFYAFSNLGVEEIMWDSEGKEADDFVIRKLITDYKSFFEKKRIGKDIFINIRIPNPKYEKAEAKILLETLESIPRSYDTAALFYGDGKYPPIFEVVVPMADGDIIKKIRDYYKNIVIGKEKMRFVDGEPGTVGEWIGHFRPRTINVIPLFEDINAMLAADTTLRSFLKGKKVDHQRVFLARSDPAMNYSSVAVIVSLSIALEKLHNLQEEIGVPIYPILGSGSAPFRGHLMPGTVDYVLKKYPSVATFTIQSAFKYDFPVQAVQAAIERINKTPVRAPVKVEDHPRALKIVHKISREYQRQIQLLAPLINELAPYVPQRRMRKLHTGLFGYSRELKKGTALPRVISFCAVLYTLGLPPDLIGLNVLTEDEIKVVHGIYNRFEDNIRDVMRWWNPAVLQLVPPEIREAIQSVADRYDAPPHREYRRISGEMIARVKKNNFGPALTDLIVQAGSVRGFLG